MMSNKNRLRGTKIYIENDLFFEDRKKQGEIRIFVKEKRKLGWNIKAGEESIFFKGRSWRWEERVEMEEKREERGEQNRSGDGEKNF